MRRGALGDDGETEMALGQVGMGAGRTRELASVLGHFCRASPGAFLVVYFFPSSF